MVANRGPTRTTLIRQRLPGRARFLVPTILVFATRLNQRGSARRLARTGQIRTDRRNPCNSRPDRAGPVEVVADDRRREVQTWSGITRCDRSRRGKRRAADASLLNAARAATSVRPLWSVAESVRSRGPSQEPAFDQHPQPSDDRHKVHQEPPTRFIAVVPPFDLNGNRDPDQRRREQQEEEHGRTRHPEDCVNHAESQVDEDRCNPPRQTLLPATKAE